MPLNKYDTMVDALRDLRRQGYRHSFTFDNGRLIAVESKKAYERPEVVIVEFHRFEGMSNPGDSSIVFAIECTDGIRGTVVSSYGHQANLKLVAFMDKVRIKERQE